MTDKQAGRLIKGLCVYAFNGKLSESKDRAVRSSFTLIKNSLDLDERNRENGKKGGAISAEKSKKNGGVLVIADIKERSCPIEKLLRDALSEPTESPENDGKKSEEKCCKKG
jgi:hypothetical protein